jgi:hypothetical protein
MHKPINIKSPNNTSKWQIGFNSAFKGLNESEGMEGTRVSLQSKKNVGRWKTKEEIA